MIEELKAELAKLKEHQDKSEILVCSEKKGTEVYSNGKKFVDFTSWDLFGFNSNEKLKTAVARETYSSGLSSGSSRILSGTFKQHIECEERFARFFLGEKGLLFSNRNQVVLSVITTLFGEGDTVFYDEFIDLPVVNACQLVGIKFAPIKSFLPEMLEQIFQRASNSRRRALIIESVASFQGITRDLALIKSVCEKFGVILIIDDTFALGTLGLRGAGSGDILPYSNFVIRIAAFDYSLCSFGSILVGPKVVVELLARRSYQFKTCPSLSPASLKQALLGVEFIEIAILQRDKLKKVSAALCAMLSQTKLLPSHLGDSPIIFLPTSRQKALEIREYLFRKNILVEAIVHPQLYNLFGIRLIVSTIHSDSQVELLTNSLFEISKIV